MVRFRHAEVKDIDYIINCVGKITDSAGIEEDCYIPPERLAKDLFSENPKAWGIIAVDGETNVGAALYSTLYDIELGQILHLDQVYIDEQCRGQGVFINLLDTLKLIAHAKDIDHIGWVTWPDYDAGNKIYEHILKKKAEVYHHYYMEV